MIATGFLLAVLFAASAVVWFHLVERRRRRLAFLDLNEEPRAQWHSAIELAVVYLVLLLIVSSLLPRFLSVPRLEKPIPDLNSVAMQAATSIGLSLIFPFALAGGAGSWSRIGMTTDHLRDQVGVGFGGFLAAVLPMATAMMATFPFRGAENQHSLLKLLMKSADVGTVALIALTATVAAPLLEELLYRVILQGWLTTLFPPSVVIPAVAVLFAFIHGWRDGLALLPLALILGYVFHRSHSYVSVVVVHALFNATMLALQLLAPRT